MQPLCQRQRRTGGPGGSAITFTGVQLRGEAPLGGRSSSHQAAPFLKSPHPSLLHSEPLRHRGQSWKPLFMSHTFKGVIHSTNGWTDALSHPTRATHLCVLTSICLKLVIKSPCHREPYDKFGHTQKPTLVVFTHHLFFFKSLCVCMCAYLCLSAHGEVGGQLGCGSSPYTLR